MIVVVGKRQPRSRQLTCEKCGALLEYLVKDIRYEGGLGFVDCPKPRCRQPNYVGTSDAT